MFTVNYRPLSALIPRGVHRELTHLSGSFSRRVHGELSHLSGLFPAQRSP